MPTIADIRRNEEGFTLVELLAAITISLIVLFATLDSLDMFTSNAAHQTRITDANDQVRSTMDRAVNDLRGASVILRANSTELVYAVPVNATTTRVQRLCVNPADSDLYGSRTTAGASPVAPSTACSSGTKLATLKSTTNTAFTYDGASSAATPALVKNVGLTFSLDASRGTKAGSSTLRASAARRSAGSMQLTDGDLETTCDVSGTLLNVSASLPGAVGPVTVTFANDAGVTLATSVAGTPVTVASSVTRVVATVTDSLGVTNIIGRDIECD